MRDLDLTGGFRLDLKTLGLFLALAGSWYTQGNKIDNLNSRLDVQEKARVQVEAARAEADEARRNLEAAERNQLRDALKTLQEQNNADLAELKGQLKITGMDVSDLKVATAKRGG